MAHVRFQLKQVNGKSQIYFGDDVGFSRKASEAKEKKKFTYKGREQKFPLRGRESAVPPPKELGKQPPRSGPPSRPARPTRTGTGPKKTTSAGAGGADTVTLTQDQLQLILNSVGKTAASERDNSVRISVAKNRKNKPERTEAGLNIETSSSPRHQRRAVGRHRAAAYDDDDEDSALGDTADTGPSDAEDERPAAGHRGRAVPQRGGGGGGGENILGLLGGGGGGEPKSKAKPKAKPKPSPVKPSGKASRPAEEAGVTLDPDAKMQRIIEQNMGKMKESELVDLLAAVYMEERKKQLGMAGEGDGKLHSEGNLRQKEKRGGRRGREAEEEEEERKGPTSRKTAARRRQEEEEEEEEERRERRRNRGAGDRRRYNEEEEDEEPRRRRYPADDRRERRQRRRYDSDENDDDVDRRGGKRETDEEEREKKAETPKFLTAVEKKRLQWEKEREENAKIKEYDPWNRPGAGAPPKDYYSETSAATRRKEEEQQRYARELDAQRREKQDLDAKAAARRGAAGASDEPGGQLGGSALGNSGTFARGRGFASLDEKASPEQEERRKRQEEHQEAIKRQVEEQQAKRAQERQRRIDEELREEAKLQRERDALQRQYEEEQVRARRREEDKEERMKQLQAANEEAAAEAKIEKARRRLHHLECSGHDTKGLRASLEAQLTARSQITAVGPPSGSGPAPVVRHAPVPGLDLIAEVTDTGTGRWATPREVRVFGPPRTEAKEDLQVQTDASLLQPIIQQAVEMAISSSAQARNLPIRTDREAHVTSRPPATRKVAPNGGERVPKFERGFLPTQRDKKSTVRSRAPIPVQQRPRWGAANPQGRRTLPQSEREVGAGKRQDREQRRAKRQAELLAEMEANQHRVPRGQSRRQRHDSASPRNWPGPEEDGPMLPLGTYNLDREEAPQPRAARLTPPLASRRRMELRGGAGGPLASSRSEENLASLGRALPPDGELGIVRTSEILNPAAAARPLPVSRENTERQLARRTYLKGLNPAQFGEQMAYLEDHRMEEGLERKNNAKNPIFNPGMVKDIPTPRQDAILQHLSDIRKNLLLKQREIETSLSLGTNA